MKKTISVYIIFGFLLTSFAGCGKLKSSPVSGLNQTEASIKDLTEEEILERSEREKVEILERELKLFDPKDSYDVETLQAIIDQRNSLIGRLIDVKGDYYNRLSKVRNNEEIFELAEREMIEILERELKLFNPKDIHGYGTRQIVIDHRNSLVAQLMDVRKDYYDYLLKGKNNSKQ